jgi:hypothetical protein
VILSSVTRKSRKSPASLFANTGASNAAQTRSEKTSFFIRIKKEIKHFKDKKIYKKSKEFCVYS